MDHYTAPSSLSFRYASKEMTKLFSDHHKYSTWRKLWVGLAKAEKKLGLPITLEQIQEMESHISEIDFDRVQQYEKELRHDVMAHIHAFGDVCPKAKAIIHLGATSCFVTDNADILIQKEALALLLQKLSLVLSQLREFAKTYKGYACLGYTHFQAAQPTTVGKRACLWLQDLLQDALEVERVLKRLRFLGVKGATGTQAAFVALVGKENAGKLEESVAKEMGMDSVFTISGQTYSRKQDALVIGALVQLASSSHKMGNDIRLLAHLKEIEEPFGKKQVGSSAMPYKRNPMLSERLCGLSRYLIALGENPLYTHATQWLERTLDDSSNRRIAIPEAFLTADALLNILIKLTQGLVVNEEKIAAHLQEEMPFFITENILMEAVKRGGHRQELHEKLRMLALKAKEKGSSFPLLQEIEADKAFNLSKKEIENLSQKKQLIGMAEEQVDRFMEEEVDPFLKSHPPYRGPVQFADV